LFFVNRPFVLSLCFGSVPLLRHRPNATLFRNTSTCLYTLCLVCTPRPALSQHYHPLLLGRLHHLARPVFDSVPTRFYLSTHLPNGFKLTIPGCVL
ncbi:hypothetical protein C8R45DRAFT_1032826, partial [Mycena sanguinolenta]